ncbi:MAG: pyruvate kinase [Paludibacteraceae bacterium]
MKQTKIVASISDRRCDVPFLQGLYDAGMNIVRINTAHADEAGIREIIENTRAVSRRIGILLDTKGPEIRTTSCAEPVAYHAGDRVRITGNPDMLCTQGEIYVSYPAFAKDVQKGCHVLFDDGVLDMQVCDIQGDTVFAIVQNDGVLGARKSVNVPGMHIELPALTEKDIRNIRFAATMDVDFIAHSFVRSAADVQAVQAVINETGKPMQIISKIENQEGVDNIDEIIAASYGIMIARGDLGIEVPIERIPGIQHDIIRKCRRARKPVIVATQMLHSMITNPRPTRAEVTDIANAIYSRTDAVMLSGETATGKYPVQAVSTMANIAEQAEKDRDYTPGFALGKGADHPEREFFAQAAIRAAEQLNIKAIVIDSGTGQMARNLAAYRCTTPIVAICYKEQLVRTLNLSFGVSATFAQEGKTKKELFREAVSRMVQMGELTPADTIAYLTGSYHDGNLRTTLEISTVQEELLS